MFTYVMYAACSVAGLIMVIGGIWLLGKQKIYLDHETKEPVEVELPGGMKVKANSPALAFFLVGFIPLLYPVYKLNPAKYHAVETGTLTAQFDPQDSDLIVYASPVQGSVIPTKQEFRIPAPFVADQDGNYKNTSYEVLLLSNSYIVNRGSATWNDRNSMTGEIPVRLGQFVWPKRRHNPSDVDPVPSVYTQKKVGAQ